MRRDIKKAIENGVSFYLFGSTQTAVEVLPELLEAGGKVKGILNSNPKRWGKSILGFHVMPPEILAEDNKDVCVIIISNFYDEILEQIKPYGFREYKNVYSYFYKTDTDFAVRGYSETNFLELKSSVLYGFELWKELSARYGENCVFLCGPFSMGDFYIECKYIDSFLSRLNEKYVFVLPNRAEANLARAYGYENIYELDNPEKLKMLFQFKMFCRNENVHIFALFPNNMYSLLTLKSGNRRINPLSITTRLSTGPFKEGCFYDYDFWFDLDENVKPSYKMIGSDERVSELFSQHGLKEGHTVVISTDAKTYGWHSAPSVSFWEKLAAFLLEEGYSVVLNAAKNGKHISSRFAIDGVKEFFFDICDARLFVERCGYFVALRSGLCDVVETSHCEKYIVYPAINSGMRDGLIHTELSGVHDELHITQTIKEYVISQDNEDQILNDICESLKRR